MVDWTEDEAIVNYQLRYDIDRQEAELKRANFLSIIRGCHKARPSSKQLDYNAN